MLEECLSVTWNDVGEDEGTGEKNKTDNNEMGETYIYDIIIDNYYIEICMCCVILHKCRYCGASLLPIPCRG